jgi:hypothetical protein
VTSARQRRGRGSRQLHLAAPSTSGASAVTYCERKDDQRGIGDSAGAGCGLPTCRTDCRCRVLRPAACQLASATAPPASNRVARLPQLWLRPARHAGALKLPHARRQRCSRHSAPNPQAPSCKFGCRCCRLGNFPILHMTSAGDCAKMWIRSINREL